MKPLPHESWKPAVFRPANETELCCLITETEHLVDEALRRGDERAGTLMSRLHGFRVLYQMQQEAAHG